MFFFFLIVLRQMRIGRRGGEGMGDVTILVIGIILGMLIQKLANRRS